MAKPVFESAEVFTANTHGFYNYRIPALVRTARGTLIAITEARRGQGRDWDPSALVARRCLDPVRHLGQWEPQFILKESQRQVEPRHLEEIMFAGEYADAMGWDQEADDFEPRVPVCTNNPVPIVDQDGETIHLVYCDHYDRAYYTRSTDDGATWADSVPIQGAVEAFRSDYDWEVIAPGPGHGLQLVRGPHAGRLVVPIWLSSTITHIPSEVAVLYSDDKGGTWHRGDFVPFTVKSPNETVAVQLADGRVYLSSRHMQAKDQKNPVPWRAYTTSADGAHGWAEYQFDATLPEPVCMGSIIRLAWPGEGKDGMIFFTIPDSLEFPVPRNRRNLTAWLSTDEAKTWTAKKTIDAGLAGYSDLAADPEEGFVYCLYERGGVGGKPATHPESLAITKFNVEWLRQL